MLKEIALDLRRYDTPEKMSSLINDTASLSIEASDQNISRVNPSYLVKKNNDYVIAPGRDKRDVLSMFVPSKKDTEAAIQIRDMLINDNKNNVYIWISPSGEWPESRVQIGLKKSTKSGKFDYLKRYDISTKLSPDDCLRIAQVLISLSDEKTDYPLSAKDLYGFIIKLNIPNDTNPLEYLKEFIVFPEKNIWQDILEGVADKNKAKALTVAKVATREVRQNPHVIYTSPIEYGAYIETLMKYAGFGMDPEKFGCGSSNITAISSKIPNYYENVSTVFDYKDQYGSLRFCCPKCGATNTRPIGELISNCQYCGGSVAC